MSAVTVSTEWISLRTTESLARAALQWLDEQGFTGEKCVEELRASLGPLPEATGE